MTWRLLLMFGDGLLIIGALAVEAILVPSLDLKLPAPGLWNIKLAWFVLALAGWSVAVKVTQAQNPRRVLNPLQSPLYALFALCLLLFFLWALAYPFVIGFWLRIVSLYVCVAVPLLCTWRIVFARVSGMARFRSRAVIVGANSAAETIACELRTAKYSNIHALGYISERMYGRTQLAGLPVLGGRGTLRHLLRNGMVDMLIMAVDCKASPKLFQVVLQAVQSGIPLVHVSALHERLGCKIPLDRMRDQWYVSLPFERSLSPLYVCWSKLLDLAFALCGLLLLLVVFPFLAVLISLDSPGSLFFKQDRVGHRGRVFRMYKFRTLYHSAEKTGSAAWVTKNDARVTRVGRILRATHLDELPQVLNILRGEMSLIGPRPERPAYAAELEATCLFYGCRLAAKPGVTGWAQVKLDYGQGREDELQKLQYDLYYIKHQSFTLDVLIILKTVVEVVLSHGR